MLFDMSDKDKGTFFYLQEKSRKKAYRKAIGEWEESFWFIVQTYAVVVNFHDLRPR